MSVSNIVLTADAVKVCSDTVTYCDRQPVQFNHKVYTNPAARLAMTARGQRWIGVAFAKLMERAIDFEDALAAAIAFTPTLPALAARTDHTVDALELTYGGWQDGPRVSRLVVDADCSRVERFDFAPGVYLSPSLGDQELPPDLTEQQMVRVAYVQQEISKKFGLNMCIGGDVELTVITADGVSTRTLAGYPDRELTARRMQQQPVAPVERAAVA